MKKKFLVYFVLGIGLCTNFLLFANDAYVERAGGSIIPIDSPDSKSHLTISMQSEVIEMDLYPDYYRVHVDFEFYNQGETTTIDVGFPQWRYGTTEQAELIDFTTTLNGKTIEFSEISDGITMDSRKHKMIDKWLVREITFPENAITRTTVEYKCKYSNQGWNKGAEYLFGTGKTWKNPIGTQTIKITNHLPLDWVINGGRTFLVENDTYKLINSCVEVKKSKDTFTIVRQNVSPSAFDLIELEIYPHFYIDAPDGFQVESDWILANRRLSSDEVLLFTDAQLRLFRNLIFAWNGHIFVSKDINDWLKENSIYSKWDGTKYVNDTWYKPARKVAVEDLSDIEKYNLEIIQKEEASRK